MASQTNPTSSARELALVPHPPSSTGVAVSAAIPSFRDRTMAQEASLYGAVDSAMLANWQEDRVEAVIDHWGIGNNIYLFDLLALDTVSLLDSLNPNDPRRKQFINLYRTVCVYAEIEYLKLGDQDEKIQDCLEKMLDLFEESSQSSDSAVKQQFFSLSASVKALAYLFSDPTSRKLFSEHPIDWHLDEIPKDRNDKAHQKLYFAFLSEVHPTRLGKLDPTPLLNDLPQRFYGSVVEAYDSVNQTAIDTLLALREKGGGITDKDTSKLGYLSWAGRRIGAFKIHLEKTYYTTNRQALRDRALETIVLFYDTRTQSKGKLQAAYEGILKKVYERLGDDFDPLMKKLIATKRVDFTMRLLKSILTLPKILQLLKSELKELHAQASLGKFGPPNGVADSYRDCFDSLLSLFILLHDLNALRNGNLDQLHGQKVPQDLVDIANLDVEDPPQDQPVPNDSSPSASPTLSEFSPVVPSPPLSPAPSPPPVPSLEPYIDPSPAPTPKNEVFAPLARRSFESVERKEKPPILSDRKVGKKERIDVPNEGVSCNQAARFLLKNGFHLAKHTDHRYYGHVLLPRTLVKLPQHGTLSPGCRRDLKAAVRLLESIDS